MPMHDLKRMRCPHHARQRVFAKSSFNFEEHRICDIGLLKKLATEASEYFDTSLAD
jgi:hypothetical protein